MYDSLMPPWNMSNAILYETFLDDANQSFQTPIKRPLTLALGIYLILLGLFTVVLNSLVLLTFICRWHSKRTPVECCIVNLSITGIVPATMSFPIYAMSCFNGGWFLGHVACLFDAVIVFFFGMVSIGTLVTIAMLRLSSTVKSSFHLPGVKYLILSCYLYAGFWTTTPLLGWGEYGIEPSQLTCGLTWFRLSTSYFLSLVITGYFIPLILIAYCYSKIWISLRRVSHNRSFIGICSRNRISMTKVTFYTCVAFFITWTPYTLFSILSYINRTVISTPTLSVLPGMLAKASWLLNPLIYFFMVRRFRKAAIDTIFCREITAQDKSYLQYTARKTTRSSDEHGFAGLLSKRAKLSSVQEEGRDASNGSECGLVLKNRHASCDRAPESSSDFGVQL